MASPVQLFVNQLLERAVKTAAQAALLQVGSDNLGHFDALTVNWQALGGFAAGGAVLSLLTSLASIKAGEPDSPSLVKAIDRPVLIPDPVGPPAVVTAPATAVDAVTAAEAIFPLG